MCHKIVLIIGLKVVIFDELWQPNPVSEFINEVTDIFFPLLVYLNMNWVNSEWPTIMAMTAFFVVADRSHHGYVRTSSNKKVFCQQGYLPE